MWYVTCIFVSISVFQSVPDDYLGSNSVIVLVLAYGSIIVLYSFLGLFADVFIGRYRLIQFSLRVQWIVVLVSTFITALQSEYKFPTWLQEMLYSIMSIIELLGQSTFQVVAIQFGIDQLEGAKSEILSAFIYWYFITERLSFLLYQWIYYTLNWSLASSFGVVKTSVIIKIGWNLFVAIWVSIVLVVKNCCMLSWFSIGDRMPNDIQTKDPRSGTSNPYRLIYNVLRYAQKHTYPARRSALTYWEDKIPSRIDFGKSKYGGPFTAEEVENTKTFLHLIKLLISLSGVLYSLFSIKSSLYYSYLHFSHGISDSTRLDLIKCLCNTVTVSLVIFFYYISPYIRRYLPCMLKRIGIGASIATICTLGLLLIDSIGHATNINVPCFFPTSNNGTSTLNLSPYLNIIPYILYELSYMILSISLIEFIIAQSPHSMKGVLIGFYYVLYFGLSGILLLVEFLVFKKYPVHNSLSSGTVYYIITLFFALLSTIGYILTSRRYKLRERDEVINFHMFAEKYYES